MPVQTPNARPRTNANAAAAAGGGMVLPFTASAHRHREPIGVDTFLPGAATRAQPQGPLIIPAYGFLRHVLIDVQCTGGVIGAGVVAADWPWCIIQQLFLQDVNGANMFGPLDGYAALWANIMGGYTFRGDPRLSPLYNGTVNARFMLRVPVEIAQKNALGSLSNQNAAAGYQLSYTTNPTTAMFTTAPTTVPNVTIRTYLEAWSQPNDRDMFGRPQATVPPRHGTSQYWTQRMAPVVAGNNTIPLTRTGNLIRNILFIARDNTGARNDGCFPDPYQMLWDSKVLTNESRDVAVSEGMASKLAATAGRDVGVVAFPYDDVDDDHCGDDDPNLWLATVQSTRMELDGTAAVGGSLQIITNDVAPAEVNPAERYVETSHTGVLAHPDVAA